MSATLHLLHLLMIGLCVVGLLACIAAFRKLWAMRKAIRGERP